MNKHTEFNVELEQQSMVHHRKYPLFFYLDNLYLGVKVTKNVAQYLLHNVTYAPVKFEVDILNGKGGDAFTRKYII